MTLSRAAFAAAMAALLVAPPGPARADQIELANGVVLTGVVMKETAEDLELEVAHRGAITLGRAEVRSVSRADEPARRALRERWLREWEAARRAEEAERAFEAAQLAKGLVMHEGEWVDRKDLERRLERERAEAARQAALAVPPVVVYNYYAPQQPALSWPVFAVSTVRQAVPAPRPAAALLLSSPGSRVANAGSLTEPIPRRFVRVGDIYGP